MNLIANKSKQLYIKETVFMNRL